MSALRGIALFLLVMWAVFFLDRVLPLERLGLIPRTTGGIAGIVAMPFLHADLGHIMANTVPLAVLLVLVTMGHGRSVPTVVAIALAGGLLLWLFGRGVNHIGASGLVFGLAGYLIASGWYARTLMAVLIAAGTLVVYGGALFSGVLPTRPGVSWDGHLFGAIGGVLVALGAHRSVGARRG